MESRPWLDGVVFWLFIGTVVACLYCLAGVALRVGVVMDGMMGNLTNKIQ